MMENPLSDEEGEKGGSWTSFWPLSPFADAKTGAGEVDANVTVPSPRVAGVEIWMSLFLSVFFVFFLHCFYNKSGNSGEKDCNLFVSSYHPDKMDWITGVWFIM